MSLSEGHRPDQEPNPFGEPITRAWLTELEQSTNFWNRTPQLQFIAFTAQRKKISPWGLLAMVQEHQASHVDPNVVLVDREGVAGTTLGEGTSLNGLVALVGRTGGGKSVTIKVASAMVPPKGTPSPDGTGQGIITTFVESRTQTKDEEGRPLPTPKKKLFFHRHALVVHAPEIKTLNAEFAREGSKTDSIIRQLTTGETVGMNNSEQKRRALLPANVVRFSGIWGAQPVNTWEILDQADDGTPQRFAWAPAAEYRKSPPTRTPPPQGVTFPLPVFQGMSPFGMPQEIDEASDEGLPNPVWVYWSPQMALDIAALQAREAALFDRDPYAKLTAAQRAAERELIMSSHFTLTTIKQSVKTAWIHGQPNPSDLDWELAQIQMQVSRAELAGVWQKCADESLLRKQRKGFDQGIEQDARKQMSEALAEGRIIELAEKVWAYLAEKPHTLPDLKVRTSSKTTRDLMPVALNWLRDQKRAESVVNPSGGHPIWHAVIAGKRVAA
jgi:hypothetical protein